MNSFTDPFLTLFLFVMSYSLSAQSSMWMRYPAISPDGTTIAFSFQGDIYTVSSEGGKAIPLTLSESYEFKPAWSPDGSQLAFASNRHGNFDVFVMPATGGPGQRLTFHSNSEIPSDFSPDGEKVIFSGLRQDLHTHVQFPTGAMAELYAVPVKGGRVDLVLTTPAHDAQYSNDGKKLIFHDRKGYENDWRKHHTSSVTRDVWVYDTDTKEYQQLSNFEGENRNPVFHSDQKNYYYLSEASGSFNIHKSSLDNASENTQISKFENHPVRFLTIAGNDEMCFGYHGGIYTLNEGGEPQKLDIEIQYDGRENLEEVVPVNGGLREATLSPNGKEYAYIFRGEIFVSAVEGGMTKRITNTPYQERSVSFSPDGKSLVFAVEVDNSWDLHTISLVRDNEPYFFMSTQLKQEVLLNNPQEEFQPQYSPDGKEVAYLEDRTTLKVVNLESKATRTILSGEYNYSYSDGDQWYQWSPDNKWFLVSYGPKERIFWREVGLIEASGNGELRNLTESGYGDFIPMWAKDGEMMIWGSTRQGSRMENGWINSADVFAMYFTQEGWDKSQLSKEELELWEEINKKDEEKDEEDDKDKKKKKKKGKKDKKEKKEKDGDEDEEKDKVEPLTFDFDHMKNQKKRLTVNTSNLNGFVLSKDGETLYYLTRFEGRNDLWKLDLRKKKAEKWVDLGAGRVGMELSKDGDFLFLLADGKPYKIGTKDGKKEGLQPKGEMLLKRDGERDYIFEHCWRQVREKFYVEDLQGVDWDFYREEYLPFLPSINNNWDFAEMLSEMLGELNASHTGSGYRYRDPKGDQTASLGLLYDYTYTGTGLKIAEVLDNGPADKALLKIEPGHVIIAIDGNEINGAVDWTHFLNRKSGDNVLLNLADENGKAYEEVIVPVGLGQEYQMLYERWVKTRRAEVDRLSDGKVGYVHVRGMNDPSMRVVIEDALGKHLDDKALIVDTRFNGGGNLHDVLADFLNGKKYMDIIPHGQYIGSQPWSKWNKPSIVVMGESNYSDAHLFPVAYKIKGVGKTLGMPVPGTGTFVWWETQIDPSVYFGIPMGGWKPLDGPFLENSQLEPDIRVKNEPGEMSKGRDQQIEAAVQEMMKL